MALATGAIVGGSLASGYLGYKGQQEAANAQKKAAKKSIAEQRRQFNILREDYAPYREAGEEALGEMQNMLSGDYDLQETPGYEYGKLQLFAKSSESGIWNPGYGIKEVRIQAGDTTVELGN